MMTNGDYVIQHHGIKGQRWGIRRFQNEDGTRTAAGMKRYGRAQKAQNDVIEKATRYRDMAKENAKRFESERDNAKTLVSKKDNDRWAKASFHDADEYNKIIEKIKNMDYTKMDKALIKKAEKWVKNSFFTDADYADFYQKGKGTNNYLLTIDRSSEFDVKKK